MNRNKAYALSGILLAGLSTVLIADGILSKRKTPLSRVVSLVAGIGGLVAGANLAYLPEKQAKQRLIVADLFNDDDVERIEKNLAEVLGGVE